jgi:hypothetical protein
MKRGFISLLGAFALLAYSGSASTSAIASGMPKFGFIMLATVDPASEIAVSDVGAAYQGYRMFECLTFDNLSVKTVTWVRFVFFYFDKKRTLLRSDFLDRRGAFAPGAHIDGPNFAEQPDLGKYQNCLAFDASGGIEYDVVAVDRVDYSDGSSWISPTPTPSPTSSPRGRW